MSASVLFPPALVQSFPHFEINHQSAYNVGTFSVAVVAEIDGAGSRGLAPAPCGRSWATEPSYPDFRQVLYPASGQITVKYTAGFFKERRFKIATNHV